MNKVELVNKMSEIAEFMDYVVQIAKSQAVSEGLSADQLEHMEELRTLWFLMKCYIETGVKPAQPGTAPENEYTDAPDPVIYGTEADDKIKYIMRLDGAYKVAKNRLIKDFSEAYSSRLLKLANGNKSEAARMAGVEVSNFKRSMKRAELYEG
jgi:DNA-binding NtrC family response regulator